MKYMALVVSGAALGFESEEESKAVSFMMNIAKADADGNLISAEELLKDLSKVTVEKSKLIKNVKCVSRVSIDKITPLGHANFSHPKYHGIVVAKIESNCRELVKETLAGISSLDSIEVFQDIKIDIFPAVSSSN